MGLDVSSAATAPIRGGRRLSVSQRAALPSEHLPPCVKRRCPASATALLSKAASFHPSRYLASSMNTGSNLARRYTSLHPCCHTEVKPISPQRNATPQQSQCISFNLHHPGSEALKESGGGTPVLAGDAAGSVVWNGPRVLGVYHPDT